MADEQFGFRRGMGTRDALYGLIIVMQKYRDHQKDIYAYVTDYEKAFDRVPRGTLIDCLKRHNDINIIENLYRKQAAAIKTE